MKLWLIGDWAPGERIIEVIPSPDAWLGNLEGPILRGGVALPASRKAGPHLASRTLPASTSRWLWSGANNHLMDYGAEGLAATRAALQSEGMVLWGAGENLAAARRTGYVEIQGTRVAVIACCEAQFGIASLESPGVAALGPWIYEAIREARSRADCIIVSCHAGLEDFPLPASWQRELYRSWILAGAHVVHGHHSHVPQAFEGFAGGVITYGLGNFAVDPAKWHGVPNASWSIAVELELEPGRFAWRPLTLEIRELDGGLVRIAESTPAEAPARSSHLLRCNQLLQDEGGFESAQQEIAMRAFDLYGREFAGLTGATLRSEWNPRQVLRRAANRWSGRHDPLQTERLRYVMASCETHRQMLVTALGLLTGEIRDLRRMDISREVDRLVG